VADAVRGEAQAGDERLRWTSVPRWTAPALPAAASYLACWFGRRGRRRARALLAAAAPGVPVRTAGFPGHWDAAAEAELSRLLADCLAGVRIIVAGPESAVTRAAALARRFGATSEELVLVATEAAAAAEAAGTGGAYADGPAARRVFCAACRRPFDAVAALGAAVTCPGCQRPLVVDHRFSRPHAAYFGWPVALDPR
jgi:Dimethylamine monooxygenase subunit DmmA-like, C-terminal domain